MHHIAIDAAPFAAGYRFDDVEIDAVEFGDHTGLPASGRMLLAPFAEIEAAADRRPVRTASKPGVFFLLIGEGLENPRWRGLPVTGDGEAGMGDGPFRLRI